MLGELASHVADDLGEEYVYGGSIIRPSVNDMATVVEQQSVVKGSKSTWAPTRSPKACSCPWYHRGQRRPAGRAFWCLRMPVQTIQRERHHVLLIRYGHWSTNGCSMGCRTSAMCVSLSLPKTASVLHLCAPVGKFLTETHGSSQYKYVQVCCPCVPRRDLLLLWVFVRISPDASISPEHHFLSTDTATSFLMPPRRSAADLLL